jgi:hypothetical protein
MDIFERLMKLDRRWIFLFLIIVCVGAYYIPFNIPILVEPEVKDIYDYIDSLKKGDIVFIAFDYAPSSMAELQPMAYAIVEHCWRKGVRTIFTALSQEGPGMVAQTIRDLTDSLKIDKTYNGKFYPGRQIVNGVDYAFLGYKPYYALVILAMGQDFRLAFPNDYYGTPLDSLPMMKGVFNYDQVKCVVDISGGNITDAWISYGQGRFGFKLALGLTGVMTAQYYPFLGSGQVFGIMGGMLGAAQYEKLADNKGAAYDAMRVQLPAHIVIILFIAMGNVGFLFERRRLKKGGMR